MLDNQLIPLLITTIQAGLAQQSISVGIKQSYQPTQQGAPSLPYIYLHKIGDRKYGSPGVAYVFDEETGVMTCTETQNWLTNFQVNASAIQDPSKVASLTAADYVKAAALALNTQFAVARLIANNVGIERITDVRQTYLRDEKALNEADPSFDFTVSHQGTVSYPVNATAETVPNFLAIVGS